MVGQRLVKKAFQMFFWGGIFLYYLSILWWWKFNTLVGPRHFHAFYMQGRLREKKRAHIYSVDAG